MKYDCPILKTKQRPMHLLRQKLRIMTESEILPIQSFSEIYDHPPLESVLRSLNVNFPKPIQAQVIPIALDGYNIHAVAKTGIVAKRPHTFCGC